MNILPKKRWHVRTKENIARVRKDEAEAAEKEKQEQLRIDNADREARLNILKQKSKQHLEEQGIEVHEKEKNPPIPEHINLFEDLEHAIKTTNKDHDKEIKAKQEEYEKKIGYLTYLGQDTNEALKKKNWYDVHPSTSRLLQTDIKDTYEKLVLKDDDGKPKSKEIDEKNGEIAWKAKQALDPMNSFKKFCHKKDKVPVTVTKDYRLTSELSKHTDDNKYKKHKNKTKYKEKRKDEKLKKVQQLREARLNREQEEKHKTQLFLKGLVGSNTKKPEQKDVNRIKPKYNSQFNPELARQNYR